MLVAISYGKGVIYCEQYDKLDGDYIAQFVRRKYREMFRKSGKEPSRLFVHDNCPILNCSKARKAVREVGGRLFAIPKCSPDLNPIENIFNIVKRDLKKRVNQSYKLWNISGVCMPSEKNIVQNAKRYYWQYHCINV